MVVLDDENTVFPEDLDFISVIGINKTHKSIMKPSETDAIGTVYKVAKFATKACCIRSTAKMNHGSQL